MNVRDIESFLRILGVENITVDEERGWVRSSCPLARWTHESGTDRKPSFGIKAVDAETDAPYFHCFACGSTGPLPRLVHHISVRSGDRMLEASKFLSNFQLFAQKDKDEDQRSRQGRRIVTDKFVSDKFSTRGIKHNKYVPEKLLEHLPLLAERCDLNAHAAALRWLAFDRKISLQSIATFKLRLYVNSLDEVGVVFPIIDRETEAVFDLFARMIDDKKFFRITNAILGSTTEYKAPNLWFGNHIFDPQKPVILVEGAIDALRLHSLGFHNVLASFGEPSTEQLASFYAPVVYLGYDSDATGREFTKKLVRKLQVPSISILDWSVADIKDAGELENMEQFRKVFDHRIKILNAPKADKPRVVRGKSKPKRLFLKDDGTFL